ncbi:MAG: hypothetical protein LPK45_04505, partial [Bacteroidota bacterium]|nr:hypothetical protein [Bacteroidota bacterium]MDX5430316.1 hypothetical protein [Bacteroidota bacterium]MDX5469077.1 hypothetical protein [Bacteroidota bacterium]
VMNHSVWNHSRDIRYRLYEGTYSCNTMFCKLKDLKIFDYPPAYTNLLNYSMPQSRLTYCESQGIKVYLEEHSKRGIFDMITDLNLKVVLEDQEIPAQIIPPDYNE